MEDDKQMDTHTHTRAAVALAACLMIPSGALANDVTTTYAAGLLTLLGDDDNNAAVVVDVGVDEVIIVGLGGTTINGRPVQRFPVPLPVLGLSVQMGAGADRLGVGGLARLTFANVALGEGNDRFFTLAQRDIAVTMSMFIDTGPGDDQLEFIGATVGGDLDIVSGPGALDAELTGLSVGGNLQVITDAQNDSVTLREVAVSGELRVSTAGGDDSVILSNQVVGQAMVVDTSDGVDSVRVEFYDGPDAQIDTGSENDIAAVTDVTGGDFTLRMGAGEDVTSGTRVNPAGAVLFDGGDGVDTLTDNGIGGGGGTQIVDFEVVLP